MTNASAQAGKTGVEIAIVGMAGRFPGADSLEEFWQNLKDGVESLAYLSDEELIAAGVGADELKASGYVKAGYFLENIEYFDARFFGFNPREAELLDPQQRLFLECAWNALEDAGYDAETYKGLIGVYAGAGISRYMMFNLYSNRDSIDLFQARLGTDKDFVPSRVSYKLSLNGPSVAIQTACSTSLVAIHMACQSLLNGECDMALAGGVTIRVPQKAGYHYQEGGVLSSDGHCRAFDEQGQGFIPSSGAGLIVLKRLEDALADRDSIYAVIKGSAINNDGSLRIGYTAPSVDGQAEVIAEAQAIAGVTPDTITYVETHGAGTKLGDPIEIKALTQAFRIRTDKKNFCAVGSVKTNIGHLDTAAGVAGLIKTVLALKHGQLPPSLNFTRPNSEIDFENSPFYVNTRLCEWKNGSQPRRAGVSSFGIGGTNAHTILEEVTEQSGSGESREHQLLVLSAKTATALEKATANLAAHLRAHPELNLADVAHTLHVGRRPFNHRRALVCKDVNDAVDALERLDPRQVITQEADANIPSVAFMFPGGGAQYEGMGLDLYKSEPAFRQEMDRCADLLRAESGYDLRDALYPAEEQTAEMSAKLQRTSVALPALFAVEYALAMLWMSWTGRPEAMIGHSLGEYVAACLAGVFSLEEALSLVVLRGKLFEQLPAGAMLSVPLPESEARRLMNGKLSVAAINAPSHCVLSGPSQAITEMSTVLSQQGIDARQLHIDVAAHSSMVEPILNEFLQFVKRLKLRSPEIPFISNVSGTWIRAEEARDPNYWVKHLRQTVRFGEGVRELLRDGARVLLEVGPGHTLSSLVKLQTGRAALSSLRHPYEQLSDQAFILGNLGRLWSTGVPVDWRAYYAHEERRRVSLPAYPFERQRYWIAPREEQTTPARSLAKKRDIADWFYLPVWKETVPPSAVERTSQNDRQYCLIFADDSRLSAQLTKRLVENGWDVVSVLMGDQFEAINDHSYTLNPRLSDDYERLLKELQSRERRLAEIIHLWSVMSSYANCSSAELLEMTQARGFYSLLFLARAVGEQILTPLLGRPEATESLRLTYITNGLHEVTGHEELCPEKATALGPCRVIPQEYPNVTCRSIDVVLPTPGSKHEELLVNQLFAELTASSADQMVAYRGKHRWVRAFEPVRIDHQSHKPSCLRAGGVYLITGGLGGVGLELAGHIAQTVPCRLILLGRSTFPARAEWDEQLARAEDDRVSQQIRKLKDIERLGAEVLVVSADVTDEEQLREVLARAREQFGQINGVVHAAGVRPEGMIQNKTAAQAAGVLAPKVRGTRLLSELLRDDPIDFFVVCSSLRSVVGGTGMVDHSAACAYLDAFAQAQNLHSERLVTSINWDAWGEVGQSVAFTRRFTDEDQPKARLTRAEGQEVFGRLLHCRMPQVIVSIQDLPSIAEYYSGVSADGKAEETGELFLARQTHARPELKSLYVAPRDGVELTLAKVWEESLGLERVGIHDNFFELGGDSIVSIRIIARANQAGLRLTPKQVFQFQTIAQLAAVAGKVLNAEAEQGVVVGPIPLTPIQSWFFENEIADPHRISLSTLLEARPALAPAALDQALQKLWTHHDALRLRFYQDDGRWQQFNAGVEQRVPFTHVDLSVLSQDERTATVERVAAEVLASLDLEEGQLMQVVLFDLGSPATNLLLIVIHHLAIDIKSWRILFGDLQTAYQQLTSGEPLELPSKTNSYKQWAESLTQRAQSETLEQGLSAWVTELEQPLACLPCDYADAVNSEASVSKVSVELPESETGVLLHEVPKVYKTEVEDALLTALAQTFALWTKESALLVEMEADGRESESESLDLSRTIGWFTTLMPVRLELSSRTSDAGEALKTIKEQLRGVTSRGHDYGLVRYLKQGGPIVERLRSLPRPEVNFIYLGQIDQGLPASSPFRPVKNFRGRSSEGTRSHLLHITVTIFNNQLHAEWTYSRNVHRRETIETLAGDFIAALRAIIAHCLSPDAGGYTPSDFPEAQLSQEELDNLISEIAGPAV